MFFLILNYAIKKIFRIFAPLIKRKNTLIIYRYVRNS